MKTITFFRLLILRIFILGALAMGWTYLTQFIQSTGFFGDTFTPTYLHPDDWDWGWRHYIWAFMGGVLLVVGIIRQFVWGDWYWTQKSDDGKVDLKAPENRLF